MASRRDQLNAYTFAKRRMLAAFLQSSPDGSDEGAPRPLRAILPGVIVGVIVMAVFGAWGMFKPTAPKGWDEPNAKVIVADKSTTRYVVLKTDGQVQLHPVLNMASAKLLLEAGGGDIVTVGESVLDNGKIPRGVTIGIPYAPDRLPDPGEAGKAKRWAVCERPGKGGGTTVQRAALVLSGKEMKSTEGRDRLRGGQLLYVSGPDGKQYVVDPRGRAYAIDKDDELLLRAVVGSRQKPQRVSAEWLATLHQGDPITFPDVEGTPGDPANAPGLLDDAANRVGTVLRGRDGTTAQYYVVLPGRVAPVSAFVAQLLLFSEKLAPLEQTDPERISPGTITPEEPFATGYRWPTGTPTPVNDPTAAPGSHSTVCNVLRDVDGDTGATTLSTWAGKDFPERLPAGSASAHVTPGSGQLYRQFQGRATQTGPVFLVTDTGLRYVLQSNGDSATDDAGIGTDAKQREQQRQEARQAQILLGYQDVKPAPIPAAWSKFLPTGPRLSTAAARQPQGS